jgi:tRNA-splicing ligase RtcB
MNMHKLIKHARCHYRAEPWGDMRVPVDIFGDQALLRDMDEMVLQQAANVARLPGIVGRSLAMPDAHWGYGFPIGGGAAFDPEQDGVISGGGGGFDIACGVRTLRTGLVRDDILALRRELADLLARRIPAGVGSRGKIKLSPPAMDAMLCGGARWAVDQGYGTQADLACIEEHGCVPGAQARHVSDKAKKRQVDQVGTLGSGNHYLEVQCVDSILDARIAAAYGLAEGDIVISIHCGSRGLGHQIGTEYLPRMAQAAPQQGIALPEKELACARLASDLGQQYLGAMNCGINCAVANRQVLTHLVRQVFADMLPQAELSLLYDVSHNTCKLETHTVEGTSRPVYVHRKGATRAFGPGHPSLPAIYREVGQPVLIGGTMGTSSYILAGTETGMARSFGSCCHGAGRAMSRAQAMKRWRGRDVVHRLAEQDILIRGASLRGVAEEAPGAYKDVDVVVNATEQAGLARKVAKVVPMICVKG